MLATHDWMKDLQNLKLEEEVIEVRFKNNRKEFFRNNRLLGLKKDDRVVVDAEGGHDVGTVSLTGALAKKQYDKKGGGSKISALNSVYRIAREPDMEKWLEAKKKERPALLKCREMAASLKLSMSIGDVEFRGDGKKLTIFYTADDRVDFRELLKLCMHEFKMKIELRQIGARQNADVLKGEVLYSFEEPILNTRYIISIDRVKEYITLNKKGTLIQAKQLEN
jgi:cell fate regulator YaaT (PSP1 superfamily)